MRLRAQRACTGLRHITVRHIREQIEQVLFTDPGERVFRPEFGAGVRRLVFEPNNTALWELVRKRLQGIVRANRLELGSEVP